MLGASHRSNPTTLPRRFWEKVQKVDDASSCWEWTGSKTSGGYGSIDGKTASRVAYQLASGVDPAHLHVMHACDNPPCVRPSHLRLGTHADNMADAAAKGRMPGRPTLTPEQVDAARELWAQGWPSHAIAEATGMSQQQAHRVSTGRSRGLGPVDAPWQATGWKRNPGMKLTDDQAAEIRRRYVAGEGPTALAREFDISPSVANNIGLGVERSGVKRTKKPDGRRWRRPLTADQVVEVRRLVESGQSQRTVADRFDVTQSAISRIVSGLAHKGVASS